MAAIWNKKQRKDSDGYGITEGVIWKQLLKFFFPILLGTFFQQLYNTADAIIVGKFVGKEALAAVGGGTGTLINLIVGFFVGLSSGATVILSQFYGARNHQQASRTVHTAIAMAVYGGVLLMILGMFASPVILRWMSTPEDVFDLAVTYTRIYFCGMIPSLIYNIGSGVLRAVGDSRRPLYFLIVSCLVNIVLDVALVLGFEMGVAGAALATILSQLCSAVLVIVTLLRSPHPLHLYAKQIRLHGDLLGRVVRIGLPAGLQSVMYSLSNLVIQAAINGFGTNLMAGYTAYSKMDGLFWMTINAFGVSITTFVGMNFGAAQFDRVKKSVRVCLLMAAGGTLALSAFLLLLGKPLFRLFTNEEVVIAQGLIVQRFLVPTFITYVCIEVFSGALRGAGDSLMPMIMTLLGVCVLRVVWVKLVAPVRPDSFLFMLACYPISWMLTSVLFVIYYLAGGWFKRCKARAGLE
ncbi:MAG: MATE family efflux transporter [Clostridia bacterium]|nr:MATE family efflux transporter [Clostridia bacterium]